jgi:hypothetical protein
MHIVFAGVGLLLIIIAVSKIIAAVRPQKPREGIEIYGLIGEKTSQNGPVTITRIVGPRGNGEPILTNRHPDEDKDMPWAVRRNGDGAEPFFDYQWRDRTEDDPGNVYHDPRPRRWFEFKKTSEHSDGNDTERIYTRR